MFSICPWPSTYCKIGPLLSRLRWKTGIFAALRLSDCKSWILKLTKTPILPNCLQNGSKMAHRIFIYFFFHMKETIVSSSALSFGHSYPDLYNAKENRSRIIMLSFCSIYDGLYNFFLIVFFQNLCIPKNICTNFEIFVCICILYTNVY